ncbi:MAG: hypothetical protein RIC18_08185 [Hoeflea sp.]|uniref:hypothetical protein n=1 Tax=Hoeflea sp. TaxID=1940281 RepID=UPI0032EAC3BD
MLDWKGRLDTEMGLSEGSPRIVEALAAGGVDRSEVEAGLAGGCTEAFDDIFDIKDVLDH